jgi:predicted nucleic acid-binding protein
MIVVDTSVWIPYMHGHNTPEVQRLTALPRLRDIIVGDVIMMEVLSGARSEKIASELREEFEQFELRAMAGFSGAIAAAQHYRTLRGLGITVRSSIDVLIASYCIEGDHTLLHRDRDFDHFERHLGLKVLRAA